MKIPTIEEIEAAKTAKGGFTRDTLESWGQDWPPKHGWLRDLKTKSLLHYGSSIIAKAAKPKRRPNGRKEREERRALKASQPKRFAPSPDKRKSFYASWEWKKLRMQALQRDGHRCGSCGASPKDGIRIVVDHIKPLGNFWELRLVLSNLQVLCDDCNRGKGDWLHTDFRSHEDGWTEETDSLMAEFRAIMKE